MGDGGGSGAAGPDDLGGLFQPYRFFLDLVLFAEGPVARNAGALTEAARLPSQTHLHFEETACHWANH